MASGEGNMADGLAGCYASPGRGGSQPPSHRFPERNPDLSLKSGGCGNGKLGVLIFKQSLGSRQDSAFFFPSFWYFVAVGYSGRVEGIPAPWPKWAGGAPHALWGFLPTFPARGLCPERYFFAG